MPATKISELMKVDRNTINNDLKFLYRQALYDYDLEDMSLDEILEKQLVRLEAQRDRFTSLFELREISIDSRVDVNKLRR